MGARGFAGAGKPRQYLWQTESGHQVAGAARLAGPRWQPEAERPSPPAPVAYTRHLLKLQCRQAGTCDAAERKQVSTTTVLQTMP